MSDARIRRDIGKIYDRFLILPNLRMHMYRVASVAELLCDRWKGPSIDKRRIIAACLLHDLGNIVKFDLGSRRSIKLLGKSAGRLAYWRRVRRGVMQKYGANEYTATHNMLEELRVDRKVVSLIDNMRLALGEAHRSDYALMLCEYADIRVAPEGVVSVRGRFEDFAERYGHSANPKNRKKARIVLSRLGTQLKVEELLFARIRIKPEQVNDRSVKPYLDRYTKRR
jgi:hypothetical protein